MKVGEVFLPDDEDFRQFKIDCTTDQGWTVCYDKSACRVSTKQNSASPFDVIRVKKKQLELIAFEIFRFLSGPIRIQWNLR